jgi:uncharacterized Zn-finger protein
LKRLFYDVCSKCSREESKINTKKGVKVIKKNHPTLSFSLWFRFEESARVVLL